MRFSYSAETLDDMPSGSAFGGSPFAGSPSSAVRLAPSIRRRRASEPRETARLPADVFRLGMPAPLSRAPARAHAAALPGPLLRCMMLTRA